MLMQKPSGFQILGALSWREAVIWLLEYGPDAKALAGGTDLMVQAKIRSRTPIIYVSLSRIPGANTIRYVPGEALYIGALATLREVDRHPVVGERFRALQQGAHVVGSLQIRNRATLAGNICNAAPSADCATPLLALGARVRTTGPAGERELPLEQFWTGPGQTALQPAELVTEIIVPDTGLRSAFLRFTPREAMDIAVVNAAVAVDVAGGACRQARIALGAVAPTPVLAPLAAAYLTQAGTGLSPEAAAEAGRLAVQAARPISDVRAGADYRRKLVAVLVKRCLLAVIEEGTSR